MICAVLYNIAMENHIKSYAESVHEIGAKYSFKSLLSEIFEIFEELRKCDFHAALMECAQVMLMLQLILWQRFKINTPILGLSKSVALEHYSRVEWFKDKFLQIGIPFKLEYLKGGSNHSKPEKVARAFLAAAADQAKQLTKKTTH